VENLALFARLHGVAERRVDEVLEELGLARRRDFLVGALSAGLKRRASVARALLHHPDLLLLDEPYANLDDDASDLVSAAVRRWRGPGRAALVATHGAKKVKRFADAGLILRDGRAVVYGSYRGASQTRTKA
jgi:ABC-type multidrug transport system ATPase subunit